MDWSTAGNDVQHQSISMTYDGNDNRCALEKDQLALCGTGRPCLLTVTYSHRYIHVLINTGRSFTRISSTMRQLYADGLAEVINKRGEHQFTLLHNMARQYIHFDEACLSSNQNCNKNSSADEIANVNFYAVRPEGTRIRWNNAK